MTDQMAAQQSTEASGSGGLGRLLASTGVSIAGQGMVIAAVPLMAASLTRSPIGVSITVAASYAAWLIAGLPAGALVDRWPRRATMVVADLVRAGLVGLFALAVIADKASLGLLVGTVFLVGVASCFFDPAAQAAIPAVVGKDQVVLARANGRLWSLDLIGRSLVGPPLGAALFAVAVFLPFAANAATFAISAVLLVGLTKLGRPADTSREPHHLGRSVVRGVSFLASHRELRGLTVGMASFNFVYNLAYATLVLVAQERLGLDERGFGALLAMLALGGLVAGWLSPGISGRLSAYQLYAICLLAQALAWAAVGLTEQPVVAAAALVLVGLASMTATVIGAAARQALTPDAMLGRVSAATRVVGLGTASLGALSSGLAAEAFGLAGPLLAAVLAGLMASAGFAVAFARHAP
jgi:MFS family permease